MPNIRSRIRESRRRLTRPAMNVMESETHGPRRLSGPWSGPPSIAVHAALQRGSSFLSLHLTSSSPCQNHCLRDLFSPPLRPTLAPGAFQYSLAFYLRLALSVFQRTVTTTASHNVRLRPTVTTPLPTRLHGLQHRSARIQVPVYGLPKLRGVPRACRSRRIDPRLHQPGVRGLGHSLGSQRKLGCKMAEIGWIPTGCICCQGRRLGKSILV